MTDNWTGEEEAAEAKALAQKLAETKTWKPEKEYDGEDLVLVGTLLEAKIVSGNYGPTHVLNVEDDDGQVWTVWAGSKVLIDALNDEAPAIGRKVRLTYCGKQEPKKAGGYAYHLWLVTAQSQDKEFWLNMRMEDPRDQAPLATAADGMEDPF